MMTGLSRTQVWMVACALTVLVPSIGELAGQHLERVSVSSDGEEANSESSAPSISRDGRFVAFASRASNLVPGDSNERSDVFVHDRLSARTFRVSVSSTGAEANGISEHPSISCDGRFVAFTSDATNLDEEVENNSADVYLRDLLTGETVLVSTTAQEVPANDHSATPSISCDGRFIAFRSGADNLVPDDTNNAPDVFLHDRVAGQTTRVSVTSSGEQANQGGTRPSISCDGRWVAFDSDSDNLVDDDTNSKQDVFLHDRATNTTARVSLSAEESGGASISCDGRSVAFHSLDSTPTFPIIDLDTNSTWDVFVRNLDVGPTERVSVSSAGKFGDAVSFSPSISAEGRWVTFYSAAGNLVPGDTNGLLDVFIHDRHSGQTTRVSGTAVGAEGVLGSLDPSVSGDRRLAFTSADTTLIAGDTNDAPDIYVYDPYGKLFYPQLAIGGGYEVVLMVANQGDQVWDGQAILNAGSWAHDWSLDGVGRTGESSFDIRLEPSETRKFVLRGGGQALSGLLEIIGGEDSSVRDLPTAFFYRYLAPGSGQSEVLVDSTGVAPAAKELGVSFPVERSATVNTGLAIRKALGNVTFTLFDSEGNFLQSVNRPLNGALFFDEIFAGTGTEFIGLMKAESPTGLACTVLRLEFTEDGGFQLTSIPATPTPR